VTRRPGSWQKSLVFFAANRANEHEFKKPFAADFADERRWFNRTSLKKINGSWCVLSSASAISHQPKKLDRKGREGRKESENKGSLN
jgi:hypothetical protein